MKAQVTRFPLVPAFVLAWSLAGAQAQVAPGFDGSPLPENERQQITLSLIERYPALASSPGIKAASAPPPMPPGERGFIAITVIYHPHAQRRGIKEAYEAHCRREYPNMDTTWDCEDVTIRRYLQLDSQHWEVRVTGDISAENAIALIEGSRRDLQASARDVSSLPNTAILIQPHSNGAYRITWGSSDGRGKLAMLARLAEGGDPNRAADWQASVFKPPVAQ
jgi:hypothetical protein